MTTRITQRKGPSASSLEQGLVSSPSRPPSSGNANGSNGFSTRSPAHKRAASTLLKWVQSFGLMAGLVVMTVLWSIFSLAHSHAHLSEEPSTHEHARQKLLLPFMKHKEWVEQDVLKTPDELPDYVTEWKLPSGFQSVLDRALQKRQFCTGLEKDFSGFDTSFEVQFGNETVATLPSFGIVDQLERFRDDPGGALGGFDGDPNDWQCQIPPETECNETMFTVIFMAYNPDRLGKTFKQINTMLTREDWKTLVEEVVLVWNGPRDVDESKDGKLMLQFAETNPLRVVYPLRMGLENDLMNRYHPKVVQVQTKAILYYDDDGPFYDFAAVQGGFELWKRHSSAQVGAMAREITYGKRQRKEHADLLGPDRHADDQQFVSHCTNVADKVDYNYRYFANYDANMVLPSGSMLHSNYLCFLWHPALEPIRDFIRKHPVHPDDVTVSTVVSQLAGRAPRVYSRRLNPDVNETRYKSPRKKQRQRRLSDYDVDEMATEGLIPASEQLYHRRLMHGINWDAKGGMDDKKKYWAGLRTEAVNTLIRYFGSINSGSIGWCDRDSPHYKEKLDGRCRPEMAKIGWLSWMNPDGTPKDTCP